MKLIYVKWMDAVSEDDWTPAKDVVPKLCVIHSCGIKIAETTETLTIAVNFDEQNDNYSCIMHIPKSCIVYRQVLAI